MSTQTQSYEYKKEKLLEIISGIADKNIAVAFSGGVDSSLLLKLCCDVAEAEVFAVTFHSKLHPAGDEEAAGKAAAETGACHVILSLDELGMAGIADNPPDRCYLCKSFLFRTLLAFAGEHNAEHVIDGTNADDLHVYRPGLRALRELGIRSPLAEAGFTKTDVRRLAAEKGISVAGRPSMPCLATRFPYGTRLDYDLLQRVDAAENFIRGLGFRNVRLRIHGTVARLETDPDSFPALLQHREDILRAIRTTGAAYCTLDLEGFRSGSMDTPQALRACPADNITGSPHSGSLSL